MSSPSLTCLLVNVTVIVVVTMEDRWGPSEAFEAVEFGAEASLAGTMEDKREGVGEAVVETAGDDVVVAEQGATARVGEDLLVLVDADVH